MFDILANSSLGFWCLAVFIAVADSIVVLQPTQFSFRFTKGIGVEIRAVRHPFLLLRKEIIFTAVVYPASPFHFCSSTTPSQSRFELRGQLLKQRKADSRAWPLSMFSLVAIALLCLLGPGLSLRYGIQASFLMVWPAIYANAIGLLLFLWVNMRGLKLHNRDLAISAFEYLICPILAINIWKKLARHEKEMPNATSLATYFTGQATEVLECLSSNLYERSQS
jgi:hypothetical protein